MPNQTFYNLPKKRQEEIVHVALQEFINNDYPDASLNQIITNLQVAKGSFYRYFNNKRDLYLFLIDYCKEIRSIQINQSLKKAQDDFLKVFEDLVYSHLNFHLKPTIYSTFLLKVYMNNDISAEDFIFVSQGEQSILDVLAQAQKSGKINKDYDIHFIYYCITQLTIGMTHYVKDAYPFNKSMPPTAENVITPEDIVAFFRQMQLFLRNALEPKT